MKINDKLKIKILKKEINELKKRVDELEKENTKLNQSKDRVFEINEIISLAEESKRIYDKLERESRLKMKKYERDIKKILK